MLPRLALVTLVCAAAAFCVSCPPSPLAAEAKPAPQGSRRVVWSIGDPWGLPAREDGQRTDRPAFGRSPALCTSEGSAAQCTGGAGPVRFRVRRPDTATVPALEYRNMMVLQKWNAAKTYAFNYELVPNAVYDVRFQTVNTMQDDAKDVQSLIWQEHAKDGSVPLALGLINRDGRGNQFFFNYGLTERDDEHWHGPAAHGAVDTWEIQFRNAQDARGWIDMYRNGARKVHYRGPVVKTTAYDVMSFGIYYYDWEIARSRLLATDITFNFFELSTIPGPVPPRRS